MQLEQDESLIPVTAEEIKKKEKPPSMMNALAGKMKLDVLTKVDHAKDQKELQTKLDELKGKSDA